MADSITIIVDMPPKEVHQNASYGAPGAWRYRADATKKYRLAAKMACLEKGLPASAPWDKCIVAARFFFPADNRRRDLLNYAAALKAVFDGIEDAGVIKDDCGIQSASFMRESTPDDPYVVIHLERIE